MRLIDADSLKYRRKDYGGYDDVGEEERKRGILFLLKKDIDTAPTVATINPVKHGRWISVLHKTNRICSICEGDEPYKFADKNINVFDYCPHCGAKMDEGEQWMNLLADKL